MTLDECNEVRTEINENLYDAINPETKKWGIDFIRYEIKDIEPPKNIQRAMILQAEAERNKRAEIMRSEGKRVSEINMAQS